MTRESGRQAVQHTTLQARSVIASKRVYYYHIKRGDEIDSKGIKLKFKQRRVIN